MRVYEFAKEHGISSKEVLDLLEKGGFELASHMTVIPEDGVAYLKKNFSNTEKVLDVKKIEKEVTIKELKKPKTEDKPKVTSKPKKIETKEFYEEKISIEPVQKKEITPKTLKPLKRALPKTPPRPGRIVPQVRKEVTEIIIEKSKPLFEVADLMGKSAGDLILALLKKGMVCNINYLLPLDVIYSLGELFGIKVIVKEEKKEAKDVLSEEEILKKSKKGETRWPIVVVMGHVDHGKTTLLDYIRKMNTAAKEKGGITQHLGAYEVNSSHGKIVFLDTPGHEAFSYLRSRGAKVTDMAILVVAADDGVKPQTIEAINHAKEANIPIIVAINKIDKIESTAAIQTIKRQLAEKNLVPEDWGGDVICVPISAKTGKGVDELLEMIVLQSQMMELKANPNLPAKAFILESNLEKGHGPVATIICLEGTIKQGDYFVCGAGTGKVRLLINSFGEKITQAGPSLPVKVVGFDKFAEIGDWLKVVSVEEYLKIKASKGTVITDPVQTLISSIKTDAKKQIDLIIKTDTRGSKEAIEGSIAKLSKSIKKGQPPLRIIQCGIGDISEGDVELAATTNSYIIGLHVKIEKNAVNVSKDMGVEVKLFQVIYHLIKYLEELLEQEREVRTVLVKTGEAYVKKVFNIKKIGIIAGCYVKEGIFSRNSKVLCLRGGKKVGEGKISSLQREGKVVKEIHSGYECGFISEGFNDWQVDDIVQAFSEVKEKVD